MRREQPANVIPETVWSTLWDSQIVKWLGLATLIFAETGLVPGSIFAWLYLPVFALTSNACILAALGIAYGFYLKAGLLGADAVADQLHVALQWLVVLGFAVRRRLFDAAPRSLVRRLLLEKRVHSVRAWLTLGAVFSLLAIGFRSTPIVLAVSWAGLFATLRYAVPQGAPARCARRLVRIASVLFFVASLGIAVVVLEYGARWAFEWQPIIITPYDRDPTYVFTLKPNLRYDYQVRVSDEEHAPFTYVISSQGIRDRYVPPKDPDEFRIVMIGDSFTMGHSLLTPDTIPRVLEYLLAEQNLTKTVTVVNAGVDGYAPWQERGFLLNRGFSFEPDLVILQLFLGNDVEGSLEEYGKHLRSYDPGWEAALHDHLYERYWQARISRWLRYHSAAYNRLELISPDRFSIGRLLLDLRGFSRPEVPELPPSESRPFFLEPDLRTGYPELEEAWDALERNVRAIKQDCAARDVDLLVYATPMFNEISDAAWKDCLNWAGDPDLYERGKGQRLIEEFCAREHIAYHRIWEALKQYPDPERLYYKYDGHFRPPGAKIVAETLCDYLMKQYFPAKDLVPHAPAS